MAQYVRISDVDMDAFMDALGFQELSREARGLRVKEKVYERPMQTGRIRIYSSVEDSPWKASVGRKKGRDAIRVQYWVDDTKVFGAKRVHRVVNWRRNMLDRVYEIEDMFGSRAVPTDSSGNLMVVRTSKDGKKFWGSRNFPRSKDTRRFNAYISRSGYVRPSPPMGRRRLRKKSCCCGADIANPCACMKQGVMSCRADEPKCPCYAAKTEVKEAVVFAPRKATGIVDQVMMNHAMMQEAQLQAQLDYLENMIQMGLLSEDEVMRELHKTFGAEYYLDASSTETKFHPKQKGTCVVCGGKFSWSQERCLDCGSGANLWSFDSESFEAEVRCEKCGKHSLGCPHENKQCSLGSCCSNHTLCGPHCAICSVPVKDVYLDLTECESCLDLVCTKDYNFTDDACVKCKPMTRFEETQEEFFKRIVAHSEELAEQAAEWPLDYLGWWFDMANESYGGSPQDMLEKPWNWKQEMTRYLVEGGFDASAYDEEDMLALKDLGFDNTYPPYLTMDELRQLYTWLPAYQDYKDYVHNYYRAEYEQVTNSPLGIIVKDADGKTYVLVPEDLAQIIFEQTKYVLDAEWRKDELLYPDELNLGMIPVGGPVGEKLFVATRNEGEEIITYVVKEETIDNEKLYRILVVIEMDGHETMMIVANSLKEGMPNE